MSILKTIKENLGIHEDDISFDSELIAYINSSFLKLFQIGIGPDPVFSISSGVQTWTDFLGLSPTSPLEAVKTYIFMDVKISFDPPQNSFTLESLRKVCEELYYRLMISGEVLWTS